MGNVYSELPDNKYIKKYKELVIGTEGTRTSEQRGYLQAINILFMWLLWDEFRHSTKDWFIKTVIGLPNEDTKSYNGRLISKMIEGKFIDRTYKIDNRKISKKTAEQIAYNIFPDTDIENFQYFSGDKHLLEKTNDAEIILFMLIYEKQEKTGFDEFWKDKFFYNSKECYKKHDIKSGSQFDSDHDRSELFNKIEAQNYSEKYKKLNPFRVPRNAERTVMYYIKYQEKISNRFDIIYGGMIEEEDAEQLNSYLKRIRETETKENFGKILSKLESDLEKQLIAVRYFRTFRNS